VSDKLLAEWFWTDRWMGSSAFLLPLEARGLYREMLTQAWRRGAQLPNDHEAIRRAIGATVGEWRRAWPAVQRFWRVSGDRLVNDTQREIFADAKGRSDRAQARAQAGAQASAQAKLEQVLKHSSSGCSSDAQAGAQAGAQAVPSVSVSVAGLTKNPPAPLSAKGGPRRYLRADLKEAQRVRKVRFGGCPHEPRCDDHVQCEVFLAIDIAERRKAAAR
jgi:uncharacterized protein YdaU (DUF1376 family)